MIGSVESTSLFTRGPQSVRLLRLGRPEGPVRLLILGPGTSSSFHESRDAIACVNYQLQVESGLVGEGYQLASFTSAERRAGDERRRNARGHDRRRALDIALD